MRRIARLSIASLAALLAAATLRHAYANFRPSATFETGTVPMGINYQGRLANSGNAVTGTHPLVFRLYDAPTVGNLLWQSDVLNTKFEEGIFGTTLDIPVSALLGATTKYLEFEVSELILAPREILRSVPYARIAESVEGRIDISSGSIAVSTAVFATEALYVSSATGYVGMGIVDVSTAVRFQLSGGDWVIGNPKMTNPSADPDVFVPGAAVVGGALFVGGAEEDLAGAGSRIEVVMVSTAPGPGDLFRVGQGYLHVPDSGRVGVGTIYPAARLHIISPDVPALNLNHPTATQLRLARDAGATTLLVVDSTWGVVHVSAPRPDDLVFLAGSTEAVRISAAGNVSISSIAVPVSTLTVGGTLNVNGALTVGVPLAYTEGGTGAADAADARTALDLPSRTGAGASGAWDIDIADLGGSGGDAATFDAFTAVPSICATISYFSTGIAANGDAVGCTAATTVLSTFTEAEVESVMYDDDNALPGPWRIAASGANDIKFDGADDTLVIDVSADEVGIGTADPGAKLEVAGDVKITGGSPAAGWILLSDADGLAAWTGVPPYDYIPGGEPATAGRAMGNTGNFALHFITNGSTRVAVLADGKVGIGTKTPGYALDVQGGGMRAGGKLKQGGADIIPSGAVTFVNLAVCPSGWSEFTAARGHTIVGLPDPGGTGVPGGVVGAGLGDQAKLGAHAHDLSAHTHTVAGSHSHAPGSHTHAVDPGPSHSHSLNNHYHSVDPGGNHNHTLGSSHRHWVDPGSSGWSNYDDDVSRENGSGCVGPCSTGSAVWRHEHWVDTAGGWSDYGGSGNTGSQNPDPVNTGNSSGNTGGQDPGSVTSTTPSASNTDAADLSQTSTGPDTDATGSYADTDFTFPYVQLLICQKD